MIVPRPDQPCIAPNGTHWLVTRLDAVNGLGLIVGVTQCPVRWTSRETVMTLADWQGMFAVPGPPG